MVITHIPFVSDVQLAEAHAKAERQRRVAERHVAVLKRSRRHPALGYLSLPTLLQNGVKRQNRQVSRPGFAGGFWV